MKTVHFCLAFLLFAFISTVNAQEKSSSDVTKIRVVKKVAGERIVEKRTLYDASESEIEDAIDEMKGSSEADVVSIDVNRKVNSNGEVDDDIVIGISDINVDIQDLATDLKDLSIEISEEVREAIEEVGEDIDGISGSRRIQINIDKEDNAAYVPIGIKSSVSKGINGVLITKVIKGFAAEEAGMQIGDIIKKVDGNSIASIDDLKDYLKVTAVEKPLDVTLLRDGKIISKTLDRTKTRRERKSVHTAEKPTLGVSVVEARSGMEVTALKEGSRAGKAGMRVGDVIKTVNGQKVRDANDLKNAIANADTLAIRVKRNSNVIYFKI